MYYRNEIEKVKKSLERDNMIAMESMKNKMREMAKAHSTAMSALSRQYKDEIDEIRDRSAEKHLSDTEVQVWAWLNYLMSITQISQWHRSPGMSLAQISHMSMP